MHYLYVCVCLCIYRYSFIYYIDHEHLLRNICSDGCNRFSPHLHLTGPWGVFNQVVPIYLPIGPCVYKQHWPIDVACVSKQKAHLQHRWTRDSSSDLNSHLNKARQHWSYCVCEMKERVYEGRARSLRSRDVCVSVCVCVCVCVCVWAAHARFISQSVMTCDHEVSVVMHRRQDWDLNVTLSGFKWVRRHSFINRLQSLA